MKNIYSNEDYWLNIHNQLGNSLRAVGWPELSEEFNLIKYASESNSLLDSLAKINLLISTPSILEVGVGIGFWLGVIQAFFEKCGCKPTLTAIDISAQALKNVKDCYPDAIVQQLDLSSAKAELFGKKFDVVFALMVLLHLTETEAFENGLIFSAESVTHDGFLILYEPAIFKAYTPWDNTQVSEKNNSLGRSIHTFDNLLIPKGFKRVGTADGASWFTNSPIESPTWYGFRVRKFLWGVMSKTVYRSNYLTRRCRPLILKLDSLFKRNEQGYSGKFLVYQKI